MGGTSAGSRVAAARAQLGLLCRRALGGSGVSAKARDFSQGCI